MMPLCEQQAMRAVQEAHSKESEEIALIKARLEKEEVRGGMASM